MERNGVIPIFMKRTRVPLSQNFLTDKNIARKIVNALTVPGEVPVVEIGPGKGILTELLVQRSGPVVAVELDSRLAGELPERLGNPPNLELISGDILKISLEELARSHSPLSWGSLAICPIMSPPPFYSNLLKNRHSCRKR